MSVGFGVSQEAEDQFMRRQAGRTLPEPRRSQALVAGLVIGTASLVACRGNYPLPTIAERVPRLSHSQWEQTVVDLFHLDAPTGLSATLAPDPLGGKTFDNNQSALQVRPLLWSDYQVAAETIAEMVTGNPELLARILPMNLPDDPVQRAEAFLGAFGLRVYRRPLRDDEVKARRALFEQGAALYPGLDPFVAGVRVSIEAFLQSPNFVYRAELSDALSSGTPIPLNDWEIAARLSYALWGSMPDAELFRAAAAGELSSIEGMDTQIGRMLDTPRAYAVVKNFFEQLYQGEQYGNLSKSKALYPDFTPAVGAEMQTELGKFTMEIYRQSRGLRELLTSTTTFVTPRIAAIYGSPAATLPPPDADGFSRIELDPTQRAGLLTRSGFLAWKGKESQPNTIQRGVFIVRRIICQPLGNPPPAATGAMFGEQPTNRERVTALTGPGTCGAGCHSTVINPAGFALEHFGALGEYRTKDGDALIDSSATYPFTEGPVAYNAAVEFSQALANSSQVHACFTGYLREYLLGREPVASDQDFLAQLGQHSLSGASVRELLISVLESDSFRYPLIITEAP